MLTTFLTTDAANYPAFNQVRSQTFRPWVDGLNQHPPASSTVIVAALVRPEYLVEVEAVVHLPGDGLRTTT